MKDADIACACATARHAARTITQLYDRALRDTGLEAPQFALLMTLDKSGPCPQGALVDRHAMDKTTVSRNVRWLEQRGWIEMVPGEDRRQRHLTLTPEGRRRLAKATPKWRAAQAAVRAEMTGREWRAMFRAFEALTGAVERAKGRESRLRNRER